MALKKVKGTLERVLDKNMQDLVRGIRNHKETEGKYIAECIEEIKEELKQENLAVKANAVNKLTYLQMLGYDISWSAFNIIEVMSSTKFTFKRIGYLAAAQSFHDGTDVLMLTTNMIRKDLSSQNMYDAGVSLNGLSCFVTPDLARDLANDIMTLMTSTRPYLRKKAVLIMYKVFLQFPEALRPAFSRLKEKLEDPDPGVQSAAVNVICELARKNPKNYLSLAPLFFKLMTSSTNNWVLIKIIKLFGALTPLEPRLGKKLIEPLTNLIHSTSAMSLLYECINTVIAGIPNHNASIQLCVQKLRILIEDSDQNSSHPKSVQSHKDLILQCLDDKDESIRLRALDLLYGMVSKKNLMEIVKKLMVHMDKAEGTYYRDELLAKIVEICGQSNYQYVTNFEWYVSILVELTRMEGTRHGRLIASQMLDVAIRVQAIRPFAVTQMAILLENSHVLASNSQRNGICEVLYAAAWICGEFSESGYQYNDNDKAQTYQLTEEEMEKRREQRKIEQSHNPHYLKGDTKTQKKKYGSEGLDDIPVAAIDLSVPLHVPGLYFYFRQVHETGIITRWEERKEKRKKKKKGQEEESDDDIPVAHEVSTVAEMPERSKRKDKKKETEENGSASNLLMETENHLPEKEIISNGPTQPDIEPAMNAVKPPDNVTDKSGDLDFWLSNNNAESTTSSSKNKSPEQETSPDVHRKDNQANIPSSEDEDESQKEKKSKKKKEKKVKKAKKEKKDKKNRLRADYEEAEGITTPSKEQVPPSQQETPMNVQFPPMSSYLLLAENESIKLTYETRVSLQRTDQIVVSIIFSNLTNQQIKDLELNVLDTLNTKFIRGIGCSHHDAVKVPFILLPNSQNEGQFAFTTQSINMPQKLKGTLTYILKTDEGSTHEKIDFRVNLPCTSYLVSTPVKGPDFTALLGSGDLTEKAALSFTPSDSEFHHILAKICFYCHFRVVEQVSDSASLYSKSIQGHDVCLLVKMVKDVLKVDGKSTDASLISNILDDVKTLLV
ncbi:hypothetical protein KUTeg_016038 [Tegillarca granosa]|uniref:AP-3 complex subunit delta domain-containing protein n=1 Tax=Tegillarca granosa TaxID=220873 RepID=A0ABQ9EJP7_TEGGR|nr:hypothetical protein KUTeg_016038 [Tegillarca granosa]